MSNDRRHRWQEIYAEYRKAMEEAPSLLDDPEAHAAAWQEIHRYAGQLEELMAGSPEPCHPPDSSPGGGTAPRPRRPRAARL
jgi:hypothetical protein